jgi:type I restriction enzyme S subunit
MSYKRLGDYIQVVNIRNKNLEVETLLGVSIKKVLMPSIANTIGTDMSRYKIIEKNQFAYGPVTSRNGDKISIALLEEYDKALVSQAYTVFEIIDDEALNAEYLMMWFRRPEFDRYARYKSHGSARETFDWEELEDTELPIPSIEKQREIVKEYNTIVNRIKLNETLNQKLEDTAQALYKHWFVDFEFPNAEGKPYKSSGGKMVFNEGLDFEIPLGWEVTNLSSIANYLNGLAMQKFPCNSGDFLPVLKIRELNLGFTDSNSSKANLNVPEKYIIDNGDIIFSWSGTLKVDVWCGGKAGLNQHLFKVESEEFEKWFYYLWTKHHLQEFIRIAEGNKTSLGHIKREHLNDAIVFVPRKEELLKMSSYINPLFSEIYNTKLENIYLMDMTELILSQMSKVETKTVLI